METLKRIRRKDFPKENKGFFLKERFYKTTLLCKLLKGNPQKIIFTRPFID